MAKNQAVRNIKSGGLRLFLLNKLKKYGTASVAEAVQRTLRVPVTRSFDLRTMIVLTRPMRKKKYEQFKEGVNARLGRLK